MHRWKPKISNPRANEANPPELEKKSKSRRLSQPYQMEMEGKSFSQSYGKVDDDEEELYHRKTRNRLLVIGISAVVLIVITVSAVVGTALGREHSKSHTHSSSLTTSESIKAACNVTLYPNSCYSSMSTTLATNNETGHNLNDPTELFLLSLQISYNELTKLTSLPQMILSSPKYKNETSDPLVRSALTDCTTLFSDAVDQVNCSIAAVQVPPGASSTLLTSKIDDLVTWLSMALTDHDTCLEGVTTTGKRLTLAEELRYAMTNSSEYTSNSLAIAANLLTILGLEFSIPVHHRRLLTAPDQIAGFPQWVRAGERRFLSKRAPPKPDLTVAKDGSGNCTTLREALGLLPRESESRFVVYVKEGVYVENITLDKGFWNVMMYGDGMNKTVISNSLNKFDGVSTFSAGTLIAAGKGFIARDMGFKNTAGPTKNQAVALRSSSDRSAFYRCSFDAYQDTLYAHSGRQFYRDCLITGTVDFIFGNAAAVFQNCSILPRQPGPGQFDTITAQGKFDPNQNTGFSVQGCHISPLDNLTAPTYFGRPWRNHSTTVVMRSFIDGILDPMGWIQWQANDTNDKLFYAEYQNFGPGSLIGKRVTWPGVKPNITKAQAQKFSVDSFIGGSRWLPEASISYNATL